MDELVSAFQEAVKDYTDLCIMAGKSIQKSYKGSFNVRIDPVLHKKAALLSNDLGLFLNQFVEEAIRKYLVEKSPDQDN